MKKYENKKERLTSVMVDIELFNKFKIKSIQTGVTFKEAVNSAMIAVLNGNFISGSFITE